VLPNCIIQQEIIYQSALLLPSFISLRDSVILLPPTNIMLRVSFTFRHKYCYASETCVLSVLLCILGALEFVIYNDVTLYLQTPDGSSDAVPYRISHHFGSRLIADILMSGYRY
jgi:hypothetical protein